MTHHFAILFAALLLDRLVGDPAWLWRSIPHPVAIFGSLIGFLDRSFNKDGDDRYTRRRNGIAVMAGLMVFSLGTGILLSYLFTALGPLGLVLEIVLVAVFLAQKSLAEHVGAVTRNLQTGLDEGRRAVSHIVGRDPDALDESGVARATIESLAENFSDGVVAPALWYGILGLPGLLAYKMLNTADSMIGHRNDRYEDFGYAAARLDDLVNWPAARLSAGILAIAAATAGTVRAAGLAAATAFRDAGLHRSPNAGWPEAAMAASLDLALAGPRSYEGREVEEPYMYAEGRLRATTSDISLALALFRRSCTVLSALVAALFIVSVMF